MTGNIAFLRACHFRRVEESKGVDFNIIKVIRREADGVHRSLNDGSMPAVSVQSCPCMHACESVIALACEHAGTETAHISPLPPRSFPRLSLSESAIPHEAFGGHKIDAISSPRCLAARLETQARAADWVQAKVRDFHLVSEHPSHHVLRRRRTRVRPRRPAATPSAHDLGRGACTCTSSSRPRADK